MYRFSISQLHSNYRLWSRTDLNPGNITHTPSARFVVGNDQARHSLIVIKRLTIASRKGNKNLLMTEIGQQFGHRNDDFITIAGKSRYIFSEYIILAIGVSEDNSVI